jgi:hypothetical protein
MCYICLYIYNPEPRFSCWMPYLICVSHVICCIPVSSKFGVWTAWRWHRCIKTCRIEKYHTVRCVCSLCIVHCVGFLSEYAAECTEWIISKQSVPILRSRCYSLSNIQMNCLMSVFLFWIAAVIWGQVLTLDLILNVKWIFYFK